MALLSTTAGVKDCVVEVFLALSEVSLVPETEADTWGGVVSCGGGAATVKVTVLAVEVLPALSVAR
jgi:hypothetical protein